MAATHTRETIMLHSSRLSDLTTLQTKDGEGWVITSLDYLEELLESQRSGPVSAAVFSEGFPSSVMPTHCFSAVLRCSVEAPSWALCMSQTMQCRAPQPRQYGLRGLPQWWRRGSRRRCPHLGLDPLLFACHLIMDPARAEHFQEPFHFRHPQWGS